MPPTTTRPPFFKLAQYLLVAAVGTLALFPVPTSASPAPTEFPLIQLSQSAKQEPTPNPHGESMDAEGCQSSEPQVDPKPSAVSPILPYMRNCVKQTIAATCQEGETTIPVCPVRKKIQTLPAGSTAPESISCQHPAVSQEFCSPSLQEEGYIRTVCDACHAVLTCEALAKLSPIRLSDHTAIAPFAHLQPHLQQICEAISDFVSSACDDGEATGKALISADNLLSLPELYLIDATLRIYYGDYYGVYDAFLFQCSPTQIPNTLSVDIYAHLDLAVPIVQRRREVEEAIEKILDTFANGSEEFLAQQIACYLSSNASYSSTHPNPSDILQEQKGSCNAFAILFRQMCLRLGIDCDMVVGYTASGGYHAWNRITTEDGKLLYFDIPLWLRTEDPKYCGGDSPLHREVVTNQYLLPCSGGEAATA